MGKVEEDSGVCLSVVAWLNQDKRFLAVCWRKLMLMSSLPFISSFTSSLLRNGNNSLFIVNVIQV
jgi:hypothetical protein